MRTVVRMKYQGNTLHVMRTCTGMSNLLHQQPIVAKITLPPATYLNKTVQQYFVHYARVYMYIVHHPHMLSAN